MAKKALSKHSRAARRADPSQEPEVKELSKLPRAAEKADLASYLVRTANRNEDLLNRKLEKKNKKTASKTDGAIRKSTRGGLAKPNDKVKINKALEFGGRLSAKIQKSVNKGIAVHKRRYTWDQVNEEIRRAESQAGADAASQNTKKGDDDEMDVEDLELQDSDEEQDSKQKSALTANAFSVLDEIEA